MAKESGIGDYVNPMIKRLRAVEDAWADFDDAWEDVEDGVMMTEDAIEKVERYEQSAKKALALVDDLRDALNNQLRYARTLGRELEQDLKMMGKG